MMNSKETPSTFRGGTPPHITFRREDGTEYERPLTHSEQSLWLEINRVISHDLHALWQEFEQRVLAPADADGWDRMEAAEAFAREHPDRVSIACCDDESFMSSSLVFIQHGTGDNFMGTTVVFLSQYRGSFRFFLYPGHAQSVKEALDIRFPPSSHEREDEAGFVEQQIRRPSGFDAFNNRWMEKAWYKGKLNPMTGMVDDRTPAQLEADGSDYHMDIPEVAAHLRNTLYTPPQHTPEEFWPADKPRRKPV